MSQTGPEAAANLANFFDPAGLHEIAQWLRADGDKYIRPWTFWIFAGAAVVSLFWPQITLIFRSRHKTEALPRPDMPIHEALDYIVNDSRAKLKRPGGPFRMESGPVAGQLVTVAGVEHEDARLKLHERLRFGDLKAWGNRELAGAPPETVDDTKSEIKRDFWEQAAPHPLHCFHDSNLVQTLPLDNARNPPRYWHLTLNSKQVRGVWPRKPLPARFADRIRRRPKISFWQHYDAY